MFAEGLHYYALLSIIGFTTSLPPGHSFCCADKSQYWQTLKYGPSDLWEILICNSKTKHWVGGLPTLWWSVGLLLWSYCQVEDLWVKSPRPPWKGNPDFPHFLVFFLVPFWCALLQRMGSTQTCAQNFGRIPKLQKNQAQVSKNGAM